MNLAFIRFANSIRGCGRLLKAVSRSQSVSVQLSRSYSSDGSDVSSYAGKPLKVAYFIEDEDWAFRAAEAAGMLGSEESDAAPIVFVPNAGDGPLTRLILEMTQCPVVTWEPREAFYSHLQAISNEFSGRHQNFEIPFIRQRDFKEILNDHRIRNLNKDRSVKLIGNISDVETYIPKLLFLLFGDEGLYALGNIPQFLFVTGLEYKLMTEPEYIWTHKNYQRTSIYKVFFDVKHILSIPIEVFNRRLANKSEKFSVTYDRDHMYLVKLCLQEQWLSSTPKSDGLGILRLLKAINVKRGQRAIPTLEKWCPDIGLSLLSLGIGMMDKIKDVPLDLWPNIYKELLQNKHFPYSSMKLILDGKEASRTAARRFIDEDDDVDESSNIVDS